MAKDKAVDTIGDDFFSGKVESATRIKAGKTYSAPSTFLPAGEEHSNEDYDRAGIAYFEARFGFKGRTDKAGWTRLMVALKGYCDKYPSNYVNKYGVTVESVDLFVRPRKEAAIAGMRAGKLGGVWYGVANAFHGGKPSTRLDELMSVK